MRIFYQTGLLLSRWLSYYNLSQLLLSEFSPYRFLVWAEPGFAASVMLHYISNVDRVNVGISQGF